MWTQKKMRLFLAAFQNGFDQNESVSSVTKLASPAKWYPPALSLV